MKKIRESEDGMLEIGQNGFRYKEQEVVFISLVLFNAESRYICMANSKINTSYISNVSSYSLSIFLYLNSPFPHFYNIFHIQSMSSSSFHKGSPLSLQITESSSINAPLHHPLDDEDSPPELFLERQPINERVTKPSSLTAALRRKSMDQPFSIIGFMERRIGEKRTRLYSQTFIHPEGQIDSR